MKISVFAKPKRKREFVKKTADKSYTVSVKAEAKEGKANKAIIQLLAEYFSIPKSSISIISGENIKQKILNIPLNEEQLKEVEDSKELQTKLF